MILNSSPDQQAILSNVSQISNFAIKATAKSFHILSSGLYANKVRAILRELGCNAWDSHVAAGCTGTPFDLHLPTQLEPWFAIRDYGIGLTHEQVVNIYTTYFESTKTESNDYIGALGLGSKSPFSYTDNFTVTAIRNGRKGIYTAFINDQGVPAIALMMESVSDEPSGLEVKFAVNNTADYIKFKNEAYTAFTYFAVKPVVNIEGFKFDEVSYIQRDIVQGIHQRSNSVSFAVMGNIAYPIDVPNCEQNLGDLHSLLNCGLEIHFNIGELDFQASREGLSYVPQTINAIKEALVRLNTALVGLLAKEADAIENQWNRALFLSKKIDNNLWNSAVSKYVADTQFELVNLSTADRWHRLKTFVFETDELASKYNIAITGFSKFRNDPVAKTIKPSSKMVSVLDGKSRNVDYWSFRISDVCYFARNDTAIGAAERGKYHWRVNSENIETTSSEVYIASAVDKTKPMLFDELMAAMCNPPRQCLVSGWASKPRAPVESREVSVLKLEEKGSYRWRWNSNTKDKVWRDAGKAAQLDPSKTYYYLPLSGHSLVSDYGCIDTKDLSIAIVNCGLFVNIKDIYGVRKADVNWVKLQKNWVNLEEHVVNTLKNMDKNTLARIALAIYNKNHAVMQVSSTFLNKIVRKDSAFVAAVDTFKDINVIEFNAQLCKILENRYKINSEDSVLVTANRIAETVAANFAKYPMIKLVNNFFSNEQTIADYINLCDSQ